jgi:7-keto-8-aminopelargonate synthetase-like enzyme
MTRYAPWRRRLEALDAAGQHRRLRTLIPTGPTTARLQGREVIVACSNDYLGLAWRQEVRDAARGGGAGGSRLISGDRPVHHQLEAAVEAWLGRPATLFSSGWQANLGVLGALFGRGDRVASDALNHASIIDGLRLSRAERVIVPHAVPGAVPDDVHGLVLEGLYSMDGDVPALAEYPTGPWMIVDEAHAAGCIGPDGRGAAAAHGVQPDVVVGTFGKAFGAAGAFVAGPPELRELLVNRARSFIFTTAPPEPVAAMALAGLHVARREPGLRAALADNAARLRAGLRDLGWAPLGDHHIVPVVAGTAAVALDARLVQHGIFAAAIRPPTVAAGTERIRFTVSAAHTADQIDRILDAVGPRGATATQG